MTLNKAIEHKKERRKKYYGVEEINKSCRPHGSDPWAYENRMHKHNVRDLAMEFREEDDDEEDLDDEFGVD